MPGTVTQGDCSPNQLKNFYLEANYKNTQRIYQWQNRLRNSVEISDTDHK